MRTVARNVEVLEIYHLQWCLCGFVFVFFSSPKNDWALLVVVKLHRAQDLVDFC